MRSALDRPGGAGPPQGGGRARDACRPRSRRPFPPRSCGATRPAASSWTPTPPPCSDGRTQPASADWRRNQTRTSEGSSWHVDARRFRLHGRAPRTVGLPALAAAQDFPKPKAAAGHQRHRRRGRSPAQPAGASRSSARPTPTSSRNSSSPRRRRPSSPASSRPSRTPGRVDIDFVLTGNDALAAGMEQGLWTEILPKYAAHVPRSREALPAGRLCHAEDGARPGLRRRLVSVGPAARIRARSGQGHARHGREAARLVQGQSGQVHVCAARQFRPGPHLRHGPALPARRQGPDGPGQRLGQDLGLSQGARRLHRVLSRPAPPPA